MNLRAVTGRSRRVERSMMLARLALWVAPRFAVRWFHTPPGLQLPGAVLEIWRERPDVQATFDLTGTAGRRKLAFWLIFHGLREMGLAANDAICAALAPWHQPWPALPTLAVMPVSWLMRETARREGVNLAELREAAGQQRLISWYFRVGLAKYGWTRLLTDQQAEVLAADDHAYGAGVPQIIGWLWDAEPDLQSRFHGPDDPGLRAYLYEHGGLRWPVLADPRLGLACGRRRACSALPFGVNLVGHAHGRFGIGEDVRMAARALISAGVPVSIRDVCAGADVGVEEGSFTDLVSQAMPYRFTMFCTTGMETVRAINILGQQALAGQTVIGFWPWELPEFPALWHHAYQLVDEVWASSRHTYDAYAGSAPVPVRHMPMAVTVDDSEGLNRADFGLPEGRFLFFFAYDALSYTARKNPQACLAAFDRAFPHGDEPVGLVIKGMRVASSPGWQALEARAAHDPRLFLVRESLNRGALLDLYRVCDCFVSLHRAEGFGRNIAECMALGRPVIVTAYSGNMDFTQANSAALVPFKLREVAPGEYPFATGQTWAEPDIDTAAAWMQQMITQPAWREETARQGMASVTQRYSPESVGRQWKAALMAMG